MSAVTPTVAAHSTTGWGSGREAVTVSTSRSSRRPTVTVLVFGVIDKT